MLLMARDKFVTSILLLFMLTLFFVAPEWQSVLLMGMWLTVVVYCLLSIKERLLLLLFQATIFTFLMTRLILPDFFTTAYIAGDADGTIRMFDEATIRFIYTTLAISICGSYLGFVIIPAKKDEVILLYDNATPYVQSVRHISKVLSYGCALFFAVTIIEKSMFVFQNGYFDLYANFESHLPSIVHKLSSLYTPLFMLYLATFPTKKEARWTILLYLLIAIISLTTGSRTAFMLALVFLLFYYCLRNVVNPEEPWLTRKSVIVMLCAIPLLLAGMFMMDFVRADKEMENAGVVDLFINFFYQQGVSAQVIGLTYNMQDLLGDRIFSFGQIIDNFNKNFVFQLMGTAVEYRPQTEDLALHGHMLGSAITYYSHYTGYLGGLGYGTSYVAEVWYDFGYVGLLLWNMMYGVIFALFPLLLQKGLWFCAFGLNIIPDILYAPRGHAAAFLNIFLSIIIILAYVVIHILAKRAMKKV
jgi:oligosaccharide repeat unit polymerase